MSPMTPAELEAIKARCNAATEGPWKSAYSVSEGSWIESKRGDGIANVVFWRDEEFLRNARTDVPALVAEVERLQKIANQTLNDYREKISASYECEVAAIQAELEEEREEVERLREDHSNLSAIRDLLKAEGRYGGHRYGLPGDVQALIGEVAELKYDLNFANECLKNTDEALEAAEADLAVVYAGFEKAEDELAEAQHDAAQANFYLGEVEKANEALGAEMERLRKRDYVLCNAYMEPLK